MSGLPQNIEDLLNRLAENSKFELNLVRTLADAVRRVDDQTLRELRSLSLQHELRRETILGELQNLATRMCHLPSKPLAAAPRPSLEQQPYTPKHVAGEAAANGTGADWRQAAQNIEEELDYAFSASAQAH